MLFLVLDYSLSSCQNKVNNSNLFLLSANGVNNGVGELGSCFCDGGLRRLEQTKVGEQVMSTAAILVVSVVRTILVAMVIRVGMVAEMVFRILRVMVLVIVKTAVEHREATWRRHLKGRRLSVSGGWWC